MGLMARPPDVETLDRNATDFSILRLGGTILGTTNKGDPFAFPMPDGGIVDRSGEVAEGYRQLGLDALIGIGGDGSFRILRQICQQGGMKLVGIPKTIDNDLDLTEDRSAIRPLSRWRPRRSTGCSRRPPATAAS